MVKHPFLSQRTGFCSFHRCMTVAEEGLPVLHLLPPLLSRGKPCCHAGTGSVASPPTPGGIFLPPDLQYRCKMQNMSLRASFHLEYILRALGTICNNNFAKSNLRPLKNVHAAGTCYKAVCTTSLAKVEIIYLKLGQLCSGTIIKFLFVSRDKYLSESYQNFKSAQSQT